MIICYPLEILFLKTWKTAGTAFEISLSQFCDERCTITPVDEEAEKIKRELGFRTSQNWDQPTLYDGFSVKGRLLGNFVQHQSVESLNKCLPPNFKNQFRKITIVRNTYERVISRYEWDLAKNSWKNQSIFVYLEKNPEVVLENFKLISHGSGFIDDYIFYDDLSDIKFLPQKFSDTFGSIFPKRLQQRKLNWVQNFYHKHPGLAELITRIGKDEIEAFGFRSPI